jgi:hypothetical protein
LTNIPNENKQGESYKYKANGSMNGEVWSLIDHERKSNRYNRPRVKSNER